jgi:hypothetical protein
MGVLTQLQRALIRSAAPNEEYKYLMRHVEDLRAGRFVIMALARQREQRVVAADILNDHGAKFIGFYGKWAWQGFNPRFKPPRPRRRIQTTSVSGSRGGPNSSRHCLLRRGMHAIPTRSPHSSMRTRSS